MLVNILCDKFNAVRELFIIHAILWIELNEKSSVCKCGRENINSGVVTNRLFLKCSVRREINPLNVFMLLDPETTVAIFNFTLSISESDEASA